MGHRGARCQGSTAQDWGPQATLGDLRPSTTEAAMRTDGWRQRSGSEHLAATQHLGLERKVESCT